MRVNYKQTQEPTTTTTSMESLPEAKHILQEVKSKVPALKEAMKTLPPGPEKKKLKLELNDAKLLARECRRQLKERKAITKSARPSRKPATHQQLFEQEKVELENLKAAVHDAPKGPERKGAREALIARRAEIVAARKERRQQQKMARKEQVETLFHQEKAELMDLKEAMKNASKGPEKKAAREALVARRTEIQAARQARKQAREEAKEEVVIAEPTKTNMFMQEKAELDALKATVEAAPKGPEKKAAREALVARRTEIQAARQARKQAREEAKEEVVIAEPAKTNMFMQEKAELDALKATVEAAPKGPEKKAAREALVARRTEIQAARQARKQAREESLNDDSNDTNVQLAALFDEEKAELVALRTSREVVQEVLRRRQAEIKAAQESRKQEALAEKEELETLRNSVRAVQAVLVLRQKEIKANREARKTDEQ